MPAFAPGPRPGGLPPVRVLRTRAGRLACVVSGRGAPPIVLIAGAGVALEGWRRLYPAIERLGTVFAWNRFGLRGSDPPPRQGQSASDVVAALRELLRQAGIAPPYLLVGHSVGGLHANLFARLHPREVAGLLLLEAAHPQDQAVLRPHETRLAGALSRLLALPQQWLRPNLHAEMQCIRRTVEEVGVAGPFPEIPLTVVTGGQAPPAWMMSPAAVGEKRAHQQELARLSPLGEQVIAQRSGHFPQLSEPGLVLDALRRLLVRCRSQAPDKPL
ncbi:MAG: alpha/beta hydrolase [Pseudomonadota bacterium]